MTYEGWTNYETWNVALWIDNEYAIYLSKIELFKVISNRNDRNDIETFEVIKLKSVVREDDVKSFALRWFPKGTPDMHNCPRINERNLNQTPMGKVNWKEIAEHWQAQLNERETYQGSHHE